MSSRPGFVVRSACQKGGVGLAALFGVLFFLLFIGSVTSCGLGFGADIGAARSVGMYLGAAALCAALAGMVFALAGVVMGGRRGEGSEDGE